MKKLKKKVISFKVSHELHSDMIKCADKVNIDILSVWIRSILMKEVKNQK